MARKKLKKILEVDGLPNVFHDLPQEDESGITDYLPAGKPVVLEIGCGRGDYSIKMAQMRPQHNFIGVDVKGARLWTGARWASELELRNVAFLRAHASGLDKYFPRNHFDEIWLPFPDPLPKKRNTKWRVTAPEFLRIYRHLLKKSGRIHLKTDDQQFFSFSLETVRKHGLILHKSSMDIYADALQGPVTEVQTKYEQRHLQEGRTIKYLCFGWE